MAAFLKKIDAMRKTTAGKVLEIIIYAILLVFVMIFFTGNGTFVYEAF